MSTPLVSVVCLCYNHRRFLREAIESVLKQTYPSIQIIIVDDASTDGSQQAIERIHLEFPHLEVLLLKENVGNCKAFNQGWKMAKGEYIIDFATDDVMHPERIAKQVQFFSRLDKTYGVVFTNSIYIDENGVRIRNHFEHLQKKKLIQSIPEGDVFRDVLIRYFISGPTMMVKSEVMHVLNGYDETLAYEDFDFWVRSSRVFKYGLLNEALTLVRKSSRSMSTGWYQQGDRQLHSTYLICKKTMALCHDDDDRNALRIRVSYEYRQSLFSGNRAESKLFGQLLKEMGGWSWREDVFRAVASVPLPWAGIRRIYQKIFYN